MLKRLLLILILTCIVFIGYSKEKFFYGQVINKEGAGIPYVDIFIKCVNTIFYTDSNGHVFYGKVVGDTLKYCCTSIKCEEIPTSKLIKDSFALCETKMFCSDSLGKFCFTTNIDLSEVLQFSCVGYNNKEVCIDNVHDSLIVCLEKKVEYNITSAIEWESKDLTEEIIGIKKIKNFRVSERNCDDGVHQSFGDEYGVFLKADSNKKGFLKEVGVYITKAGAPTSKFRLHIYTINNITKMPYKDVTDTNIIVNAKKGNEWVRIDFRNKFIPINNGIFIIIESVSGKFYYPEEWNNQVAYTQTQVIGMSEHPLKGTVIAYRKSYESTWKIKQYHLTGKALNALIYAKYCYIKGF